MLRKTFYAMLTVILMMGAASAQENKPGLPGQAEPLHHETLGSLEELRRSLLRNVRLSFLRCAPKRSRCIDVSGQ
jgi:hypothetical protein